MTKLLILNCNRLIIKLINIEIVFVTFDNCGISSMFLLVCDMGVKCGMEIVIEAVRGCAFKRFKKIGRERWIENVQIPKYLLVIVTWSVNWTFTIMANTKTMRPRSVRIFERFANISADINNNPIYYFSQVHRTLQTILYQSKSGCWRWSTVTVRRQRLESTFLW